VQKGFRDAQVRRRTDREKFCESFNDSKQRGEQVVVQIRSSRVFSILLWMNQRLLHHIGINAAQVVSSGDTHVTIAVTPPEGNAGFIVRCRLQLYVMHTRRRQLAFRLP